MPKSTKSKARRKPAKPTSDFPMYAHASGQWARKIKGKLRYFGAWDDPAAALELHDFEYPFHKQGETPPTCDTATATSGGGCTTHQLCNAFLRSKEEAVDAGEISPRTFIGYYQACKLLIAHFGKPKLVASLRPQDFGTFRKKLAGSGINVKSLEGRITQCRVVFKYASDNGLIDRPVAYGQNFARPSAKSLRRNNNQGGAKVFTQEEVLRILATADVQLRAMCFLGVNCGFGNSDVASLPRKAVDLKTGWVEFARAKTEIQRRIPLWAETIEALEAAHTVRPEPAEPKDEGLCFLTKQGRPWVRIKTTPGKAAGAKMVPIDAISGEFAKILKKLKINGRRGLGFYCFRHCFETFAGESVDQIAVDSCMGHVPQGMGANYRHAISDKRLRAVVETVHEWLFGDGEAE